MGGQQQTTMNITSTSLKYVDHTYHDFSNYIIDGGELTKHKKSDNNFPARLHKLVSDGHSNDVITWMPHGRAWKILDKERLVSEVIPNYYVCKKFESFTRQLNGWGFKRLHQTGPDHGSYYHECFLRDLPDLTCLIRRLPSNLGKSTPFPDGEPNFYLISEQYPLPPKKKKKKAGSSSSSRPSSTQGKGNEGGASASNPSGGGTSKLDMFANLAASSEQPPSSSMVPYQGNHPISDDLMTMSMGFNFSNMSSDPFAAQYASQYFGNFDNNHQTAYPTSQQQHELYLRSQQASQHVPNHEDYTYFPQKSSSNYNNNSQVGTYGNAYLGTQQPGEAAKSQQKQESKEKAANTVSVDPFEPIPVKSPRGSKKCIEGKEEGEANKE